MIFFFKKVILKLVSIVIGYLWLQHSLKWDNICQRFNNTGNFQKFYISHWNGSVGAHFYLCCLGGREHGKDEWSKIWFRVSFQYIKQTWQICFHHTFSQIDSICSKWKCRMQSLKWPDVRSVLQDFNINQDSSFFFPSFICCFSTQN